MNPTLTVFAYGNVDALHGIFNAVAMIMSSRDFEHMIRLAVVIGFAVVATLAMFPGNLGKGINWLVAVMVITGVMLVPKADVSIVDRTGQQSTVVVSGVPWTLALLASVKSSIGMTLTEAFETAFQTIPSSSRALPSQLSYLDNGMMFGSRLVRATREAQPVSSYDQTDLVQFIRSCVVPELGRNIGADAAARSTDLQTVFGNTNPALSAGYHDANAGWVLKVDTCPNVWNALQNRLNAAGVAAVSRVASTTMAGAFAIHSGNATARAGAAIASIYGKASLASASASASQIMVQNILINATADAAAVQASSSDPGLLLLASMRTQAIAQMNAGSMVQGRIAEESLPMIRNITEAILFAAFPLVCILLVASEGRAMGGLFKSYVLVLLWVELWPPMFAVVNYLQTLEAAKGLAGAGYMPGVGSGLSVATASSVYTTSVSSLGATAWMVTFVPVLAAAVLFGFDKIMSITGAMGGGTRAAQTEAAAATKGNLAMGNVSFDQRQLAAYETSPSMYTTQSIGGTQAIDLFSGERVSQYASSRHLSSVAAISSIGEGVAASAQVAQSRAERSQKSYEASLDAAFNTARAVVQSYGESASRSLGYDVTKLGSDGLSANDVDEEAKRLAKQHGIQDTSGVSKQLQAGLGGAGPAGLLALRATGSTAETEQLAHSFAASVDTLRRTGQARKQEVAETFRSSEGFEEARRSNKEASARVESSLRDAASYREATSSDLARSQQLASDWQAFQRYAQQYQTDFGNLIEQEYQRRGWSVHDGVADPRRHEQVVRALFEQGAFRPDGPGGTKLFVPGTQGFGPTQNQTAPAMHTAEAGEEALRHAHRSAEPGGGREAIGGHTAANDASGSQRERQLGVSPQLRVEGGAVEAAVETGQADAARAAREAGAAVEQRQGAAQLEQDARRDAINSSHKPLLSQKPSGERVVNPALDALRGHGSEPRQFGAEAEAESTRRSKKASDAAAQRAGSDRAEIPTRPPK